MRKLLVSLLGLTVALSGCAVISSARPASRTDISNASNNSMTQYPPLYRVNWEICGVEKNMHTGESGCVKNFTPRWLWGPVGSAKLIEDAYHNGNDDTQEYHLAISSAGCFPPNTQRAPQAFYEADASFQVKKGTTPTISLSKTLVDNSQVHSLLTQKPVASGLIGNIPCKPIAK